MITPSTEEMEEAGRDLVTPQTNLMQLMFCKETVHSHKHKDPAILEIFSLRSVVHDYFLLI